MPQRILLKRSTKSGEAPEVNELQYGELALNTADGKIFMKRNDGSDAVVEVQASLAGESVEISKSSSVPIDAKKGDLWYDIANDVLKAYDGTNWIEVGSTLGSLVVTGSTSFGTDSTDTHTFDGDVDINDDLNVDGNVTINGNVDLGDGSDTININGTEISEWTQDIVGSMFSGNTESGITATYQDADGTIDLDVNDPTITLAGAVSGSATMTNLGNVTINTTAGTGASAITLGTNTQGNYMVDVAAGSGISVSHTQGEGSTATVSHSDTSSISNVNNSGNTFIQDLTFDTYGHVTGATSGTVTVGNGTLTVQGTGALGGSGTFKANQSSNATISITHDDTSTQSSVSNSGNTFIRGVTLDGYGHVTGLTSGSASGGGIAAWTSSQSITGITGNPNDNTTVTQDFNCTVPSGATRALFAGWWYGSGKYASSTHGVVVNGTYHQVGTGTYANSGADAYGYIYIEVDLSGSGVADGSVFAATDSQIATAAQSTRPTGLIPVSIATGTSVTDLRLRFVTTTNSDGRVNYTEDITVYYA